MDPFDDDEFERKGYKRLNLEWSVPNYSTLPGHPMLSEPFSTSQGLWRLIINPGGCDDNLSVYLELLKAENERHNLQVIGHCEFVIESNDDNDHKDSLWSKVMTPGSPAEGFGHFISRKDLLARKDSLLPGDTLTLIVRGYICRGISPSEEQDVTDNMYAPIYNEFKKLKDSMFNTDVILIADGKELPAHKAVLANKSFTFDVKRMMSGIPDKLTIRDISAPVLQTLLIYLYNKTLPIHAELPPIFWMDLLAAAEKYHIREFSLTPCESNLCGMIFYDNVFELLKFAIRWNSSKLKMECLMVGAIYHLELKQYQWWKKSMQILPKNVMLEFLDYAKYR